MQEMVTYDNCVHDMYDIIEIEKGEWTWWGER